MPWHYEGFGTLVPMVLSALLVFLQSEPPKGAIVLFDGRDASQWHHRGSNEACKWDIADGCLVVRAGTPDLMTKQEFKDYKLHIEFWLPNMEGQKDQAKANSGVYQHARYEVQILDSWKNPTYKYGGCGAIYGQYDPASDAIVPPETWNTYDITFIAPRLDKLGKTKSKPRMTVYHNGILIHKDVEIEGSSTTSGLDRPMSTEGPVLLQNHGCPIRFRNIWLLPIKSK